MLPYSPEKTGLHLHGLNRCTRTFHTLSHDAVDQFAEEWGFIRTPSITLSTIEEVQTFTSSVSKTGEWEGEPVEGFVVRTHITKKDRNTPYDVGNTFFFKVKFDEPYMMYRDWREVTKALLSQQAKGAKMNPKSLPKSKMKRPETVEYVNWVIMDIQQHPALYSEYTKNKGIIATRERFLKWKAKGGVVDAAQGDQEKVFGKTIIVPVAIPGCGALPFSFYARMVIH